MKLTHHSLKLFIALADDAANWGGSPLWGGNVGGSKASCGHLTDLKRKGLVTTWDDDGDTWVEFTSAGIELAAKWGVSVD